MRENYSQPWAVRTEPWNEYVIVAGCFGDIGGDDVAKANARLIAAAPELLVLAERWVALNEGLRHPSKGAAEKAELLADTRAAIAKASGK